MATERGGAKRTQRQREADLQEINKLYVRGANLREIAAQISANREYRLSHVTIKADVDLILERWRETLLSDIDRLKSEELARINHLECEAWAAWERSKQDAERTLAEKRHATQGTTSVASVVKEGQCGDPRYLQRVEWCIEKRCKILGLDAPAKVAQTTPDGESPWNPESPEQYEAHLRKVILAGTLASPTGK